MWTAINVSVCAPRSAEGEAPSEAEAPSAEADPEAKRCQRGARARGRGKRESQAIILLRFIRFISSRDRSRMFSTRFRYAPRVSLGPARTMCRSVYGIDLQKK